MLPRPRVRARDLAPRQRKGLVPLVLLAIALLLVIVYKATVGDEAATFFHAVTGDPEMDLPETTALSHARADGGADATPDASTVR